jgi:hypothetical protein
VGFFFHLKALFAIHPFEDCLRAPFWSSLRTLQNQQLNKTVCSTGTGTTGNKISKGDGAATTPSQQRDDRGCLKPSSPADTVCASSVHDIEGQHSPQNPSNIQPSNKVLLFASPTGVADLVHNSSLSDNDIGGAAAATVEIGKVDASISTPTAAVLAASMEAAKKFEGYSFLGDLLDLILKRDAVLERSDSHTRPLTSYERAAASIDDAIDVSKLKKTLVHHAETFRGFK